MSPLLCIVGPTAAGKTALAVALARTYRAEIVGADASQVYRGLDLGTGKATAGELAGVPHHLIDVAEPDEPFDAAAYARLADAALHDIAARGRRAIVCGGTGLYLKALLHGLCPAPPVTPGIRDELVAAVAAGELDALHAALRLADPVAAARIHPHDAPRIERALGVFRSTGRTLSAWQADHAFAGERYAHSIIGLRLAPAELDGRIETRVRRMFGGSIQAEAIALRAHGHGPHLRSLAALGYRAAFAVIDGQTSVDEAIARTIVETRRYARRQLAWFRAVPDVRWFDVDHTETGERLNRHLHDLWGPT